jgi:hypothetical protein
MRLFVKAVVTGFAFTLGASLFKKIAPKIGLADGEPRTEPTPAPSEAAEARLDDEGRSPDGLPSA